MTQERDPPKPTSKNEQVVQPATSGSSNAVYHYQNEPVSSVLAATEPRANDSKKVLNTLSNTDWSRFR
jgi:hypothetical protein